jgi:hypothetical protein
MTPRARIPVIDKPVVDHLPEYVRGFPMHMALTVALLPGTAEDDRRVPRLYISGATDLRAKFTREGTGEVTEGGSDLTRPMPRPSVGEADDIRVDFVELIPGEPRRMLFDAAHLQADAPLAAGRYHVELTFRNVAAVPFDIAIRDATAPEKQALARLAKLDSEWMVTEPSGAQPPRIGSDDPLRYLRVLHYLYTTPTTPAAVDVRLLEVLSGFYEPDAMLLRFELAQLRSDQAGQDRTEAAIRSRFPSSIPALRELRESGGDITLKRDIHTMSVADRRQRSQP